MGGRGSQVDPLHGVGNNPHEGWKMVVAACCWCIGGCDDGRGLGVAF